VSAPTRDTAGEGDDPITPDAGERIVVRVLDLAAALRGAGVATTQAEAIDAARALAHVDLLEREQLREALASLLLSSHHHRRVFDELFDLHFPVRPPGEHAEAGASDHDADDPDALIAEMVERLLEGSDADIRRMAREAVEAFGRVEARDGAPSYFQYLVMRAVDLPGLLRELLRRSGADEGRLTPMQERLLRDEFEARLRLLREELERRGLDHCLLDGSTRDRAAVVDRFQKDASIPVFLISLKAGGVGLNLTGADTVIHFDPWWNPAVEDQATDRAHRIGQTRVVTSYKLITRGTVEEKILSLQQRKRDVIAATLTGEDVFTNSLGWDEIQELLS
jgi:hypothetical protein